MIKFSLKSWIVENDFFFPAHPHWAVELYFFNFFRFVENIIWFKQSQQMKKGNSWFQTIRQFSSPERVLFCKSSGVSIQSLPL